jgi:hypothetical protein
MQEVGSMSKALSIKDVAIYDMVAELAEKTGLSMTQAVKRAVASNLAEVNAKRAAELDAWVELMKANPLPEGFEFVRDASSYEPEEILP